MLSIILACLGLIMVILPQLITMRRLWLRYLVDMRYADVKEMTAVMAYEATTEFIHIDAKWNNLGLQVLKRYSTYSGIALMAISLVLAFYVDYQYFVYVLDIILGGTLWILLERITLSVCFKKLYLKESQLAIIAMLGPFIISVMILAITYVCILIYPSDNEYQLVKTAIENLFYTRNT